MSKYNDDKSGIYQIKNMTNNKIYIGSSKNIYERWDTHKSRLRWNKHCNRHLQSAWNKDGEKSFEFSILEIVDDLSQLKMLEQKYIDTLQPFGESGYNLCPNTNSYHFNSKMPNSWYKNIKKEKSPLHIKHMRDGRKDKKSIIVFDINRNQLFTATSSGEVIEILNNDYGLKANKSVIRDCCNHKRYVCYNMIFLYNDEYIQDNKIIDTHINHRKRKTNKKVVRISTDFLSITIFDSLKEASNGDRSISSGISRCCSGKFKTSNGFYWLYYEDYEKHKNNIIEYIKDTRDTYPISDILQLDMNYNIIKKWSTISEILRDNKTYDGSSILKCINGQVMSAYKYRWLLLEDYNKGNYVKATKNGQAKPVLQLDLNNNPIKEWYSCSEIEKNNPDFKSSSIKGICNGSCKTHKYKGFYWYYKEDFNQPQLCSNE